VFAVLNRLLENLTTRIVLSVAIVISLVPHDWLFFSDAWFLALFGPEFVFRVLLAFREEGVEVPGQLRRRTGWRRAKPSELLLLLFDFLALASFLPISAVVQSGRWLRLFRLSRTLLLLRYWAPVVRDLWTVVSGRERRRQLALVFGTLIATTFAGAVGLDHLTTEVGDDFDGDGHVGDEHDHDFLVRMWWAFRQLEDPGNLLASPHDVGTLIVSVGLTLSGLFVISFIIGVGTDVVDELTEVSRLRPPGLNRHTVLVNLNGGTKRLLSELLGEERKFLPGSRGFPSTAWFSQLLKNARRGRDFLVVGRGPERPAFLNAPEFSRVVYRAWDDDDDDTLLTRGDVAAARRVVILTDAEQGTGDGPTIRSLVTVVERLREVGIDTELRRKLVAEIVDEDNVSTAHRAASRAPEHLMPTVVPTERLLARFLACIGRRPGLADVLTELLRSQGREVYSFDYRYADRDETTPEDPPSLGADAGEAMRVLTGQAANGTVAQRVIPIGLLTRGADHETPKVLLNPTPGTSFEGDLTGFAAIAPHFDLVSEFATKITREKATVSDSQVTVPKLTEALPTALHNVVVCGFRSASVSLLESLLVAEPDAEILILVGDEKARRAAMVEIGAHTRLVEQGLLPGRHGRFVQRPNDDGLRWTPTQGEHGKGSIWVEIADWTSTEHLANLPRDRGSVSDADFVVFVSDEADREDARTTTALMKIEDLCMRLGKEALPRLVAEVDDPELARRLTRRYSAMERSEVHVFSVQELRSLVMFQSIVVPHFGQIYEELMSPWGQSLAALTSQSSGQISFADLAADRAQKGQILVAIDQRDDDGRTILLGRGGGSDQVDLARSRLWVIKKDHVRTTPTGSLSVLPPGPPRV
jgi:hypothetical protein